MSILRHAAVAIGLAGITAVGTGLSAAASLPTSLAVFGASGASDVVQVQWGGQGWNGELPPRPPVPADLAARQAERGYYPFARYPYYLPYYYYSYPRYSAYDYVHEWYYAPYYRHSGRPY
jgi:hypothetical protein